MADLVVTAFTQQKKAPDAMGLGVSTWRRAADVALPTRIKSSANYLGGRLARIEVGRLGYDEAVMLNDAGRVAETSGACILIADQGRVITPPASEGCLDSITVDVLEQLSGDMRSTVRTQTDRAHRTIGRARVCNRRDDHRTDHGL